MNKLRKWFIFLVMRIKWKKQNKHNKTWPGRYFDINKVKIGKNTYGQINAITYQCKDSILEIGNYCSISCGSLFILGGEHRINTISTFPFKERVLHDDLDTFSKGKIVIDDDVWIGESSIVLSGVHIGQGAVIGAGAVVVNDVPPYAIVGGVPAKILKYRFNPIIIKELMKIDYNKISEETIKNHIDELYEKLVDTNQLSWLPRKN